MPMKLYLFASIIFFASLAPDLLYGQYERSFTLEGRVFDQKSQESIAYANIYNLRTKKGAVSNELGYFKLQLQRPKDTLLITYLGHKQVLQPLDAHTLFYEIAMTENGQLLNEVTIVPKDNTYLFDMVEACRKNAPAAKVTAKSFYSLKSFIEGIQVELVEGFYNADISGYDLEALNIKTARVALLPYRRQLFASMESSRAISMLKLCDQNDYFPKSPLEMGKKALKKSYFLRLNNQYIDENRDSIFVLEYVPKDTSGRFFSGFLWINAGKQSILKVKLNCPNAVLHPFLPLFPTDTITKVAFQITKTFQPVQGKMTFQHVDFSYTIQYHNRNGESYPVTTSAIVYAYDFDHRFQLPFFRFSNTSTGDYKKINAIPYNAYFWKHNDELILSTQHDENERFYAQPNAVTNTTIFEENQYLDRGMLEFPYVCWSKKRMYFRGQANTSAQDIASITGTLSVPYRLNGKLFLDINPYPDTLQIVTAAIFDPYDSFYRLPLDNTAHCFINLYFDLVEIHRRKLEAAIAHSDKKTATIEQIYKKNQADLDGFTRQFFTDVEGGKERGSMLKWNKLVFEQLKVDNMDLFGLK
jgi:hypothetical protein